MLKLTYSVTAKLRIEFRLLTIEGFTESFDEINRSLDKQNFFPRQFYGYDLL